jgi:hypothetical protein
MTFEILPFGQRRQDFFGSASLPYHLHPAMDANTTTAVLATATKVQTQL